MWTVLLWMVVAGSLLAGVLVVSIRLWLQSMARHGKSGTEYLDMALAPLWIAFPVVALAGAGSALALAVDTHRFPVRVALSLGATVLGLWGLVNATVLVVGLASAWFSSRR